MYGIKIPYMMFVKFISRLVDGTFPEHFDTKLRRKIQIILSVSLIGTIPAIVFINGISDDILYLSVVDGFSLLLVLTFWRLSPLPQGAKRRQP